MLKPPGGLLKAPSTLRLVNIFNALVGLWLQPPRRYSSLVSVFEWTVLVAMIAQQTSFHANVSYSKIKNDWIAILEKCVDSLPFSYAILRTLSVLSRKKQLENIFEQAQNFVNGRLLRQYQLEVLKKVNNRIKIIVVSVFSVYVSIQVYDLAIKLFVGPNIITSALASDTVSNATFVAAPSKSIFAAYRDLLIGWAYGMVIMSVAVIKLLGADMIYLMLYKLVAEELQVLKITVQDVVLSTPYREQNCVNAWITTRARKNYDNNLENWISTQQELARLMENINEFAGPCVVLIFTINSFSLCCMVFLCTKLADSSPIVAILILGYWAITVLETFTYCYAGHLVQTQAESLSTALCRCPWLHAQPSLTPGLNLVAQDCRRSFVARGGPFFTLSLEFFATIVGAVLTYLVVLLQFK